MRFSRILVFVSFLALVGCNPETSLDASVQQAPSTGTGEVAWLGEDDTPSRDYVDLDDMPEWTLYVDVILSDASPITSSVIASQTIETDVKPITDTDNLTVPQTVGAVEWTWDVEFSGVVSESARARWEASDGDSYVQPFVFLRTVQGEPWVIYLPLVMSQ